MAKTKPQQGQIYVAKESFATDVDGVSVSVVGDVTLVREGHPLLKGREHLFKAVVPHYEVEQPA